MIINPRILRKDLVELLSGIDAQMDEVRQEASRLDIPPQKLRDHNGGFMMSPLLLAKVQALAALVQLNASDQQK